MADTTTDAPPGLRARRREQIRADLRSATLSLILEQGPDAASVTAITERAGLARRTFFNHFPTRDDAIVGWGSIDADKLAADVAGLEPALDDASVARRTVHLVLDQLVEDPIWPVEIGVLRKHPELRALFAAASRRIEAAVYDVLRRRSSDPASPMGEDEIHPRTAAERHLALLAIVGTGALRVAITAWVEDPALDLHATLDELFTE